MLVGSHPEAEGTTWKPPSSRTASQSTRESKYPAPIQTPGQGRAYTHT